MNTEKTTTILIQLDKSKQLTVEAKGTALPEAIQLCLAAIEAMCKSTLARATEPALIQSLEEDMYEMINMGASSLLSKLFPNIEMRPDLTVDAMLKAEDNLISENAGKYVEAYESTAQAKKDEYEHTLAKANIAAKEAAQPVNREQRRKLAKQTSKSVKGA